MNPKIQSRTKKSRYRYICSLCTERAETKILVTKCRHCESPKIIYDTCLGCSCIVDYSRVRHPKLVKGGSSSDKMNIAKATSIYGMPNGRCEDCNKNKRRSAKISFSV